MSFDQDRFLSSPTQEEFNFAKKSELLGIAKHYNVTEARSSMPKHENKNVLVQYLVDEEIFDDSALSLTLNSESLN